MATATATSTDGTTIGYRQVGQGPGLVLLHGAMSSSYNHVQLAEMLADVFTVYAPDRRGRGLSGPFRKTDRIRSEIDDLAAVLRETGTRDVFGVSSGAIIALEAAREGVEIERLALFEPPLFPDDTVPAAILTRFDQEMAEGRIARALVTRMKGAQMGPPIMNLVPSWLLERLTNMMIASEDKQPANAYVPMRTLAPTLHHDFQLVTDASGRLERFAAVRADVLLLGGGNSPGFLKVALDHLEWILPRARRAQLAGLDHAGSWNRDRGGRPGPVADALRHFFV